MNPSHLSFGVGVITPRWLFVLAGAPPPSHGRPIITDETLDPFDIGSVQPGDVVGIGIHTGNALRGYDIGTLARATVASRLASQCCPHLTHRQSPPASRALWVRVADV